MPEVSTRIKKLLEYLKNDEALLIPSTDEFLSEYAPIHLKRLEYISGFKGSNGMAIIGHKLKLFFTDGRYLAQAKKELIDFEVLELTKNYLSVLKGTIKILQVDPLTISSRLYDHLVEAGESYAFEIKLSDNNLIDAIWLAKPQDLTIKAPLTLDDAISGESTKSKLAKTCQDLTADYLLLTSPDSICWLLNIRGEDIESSGFYLSYLLLAKDGTTKLIRSPHDAIQLIQDLVKTKKTINLDCSKSPALFKLKFKDAIIDLKDPCETLKAIKNKTEIMGFETAHLMDAIALVKLIKWIEENLDKEITELDVSDKLLSLKKGLENFIQPSFTTISAFAKNSAIIHYQPSKESNKKIARNNLFLLDSGSHFLFGTTDVTRTFHFGTPTAKQIMMYTLVLKSLITICSQSFPAGTKISSLDLLARHHLWRLGCDYPHSTGHGVGHFLSVHESPAISSRAIVETFKPGMVLALEPGFYLDNKWGIRLENVVVVRESKQAGFLEFKPLTLVPFELNLINFSLLNNIEITWLAEYHTLISKHLKTHLKKNNINWFLKKYLPEQYFRASSVSKIVQFNSLNN